MSLACHSEEIGPTVTCLALEPLTFRPPRPSAQDGLSDFGVCVAQLLHSSVPRSPRHRPHLRHVARRHPPHAQRSALRHLGIHILGESRRRAHDMSTPRMTGHRADDGQWCGIGGLDLLARPAAVGELPARQRGRYQLDVSFHLVCTSSPVLATVLYASGY